MIRTAAACALLGVWWSSSGRGRTWSMVAMVAIVDVRLAIPIAVAMVAVRAIGRRRRVRVERERVASDVTLLGELVLLGLTAGLPIPTALTVAVDHLTGPLRREVSQAVRKASTVGAELALAGAGGAARDLYTAVAGATASGASMVDAVAGFVAAEQQAVHARRLAAAKRLPVRLMAPLALLMLPGFVLLTVAPAVVGALDRFGS